MYQSMEQDSLEDDMQIDDKRGKERYVELQLRSQAANRCNQELILKDQEQLAQFQVWSNYL